MLPGGVGGVGPPIPSLPVSVAACGPSVNLGGAFGVLDSARGGGATSTSTSARSGGLSSVRGLFRRKKAGGGGGGGATTPSPRGSREASEDEADAADGGSDPLQPPAGETYIL